MSNAPQLSNRFAAIFSAFMVFCVLVWLWGLGLFMLWPWHQGGEWLPDFPIVAVCADDTVCAVPQGKVREARAAGRIKSLQPAEPVGETFHDKIAVQWKQLPGKLEVKASAWNFQTTVRYRLDNETPVLLEYQEISGKVFLYAMAGAFVTLLLLYARKLRK